ncbi:MAG TPA: response regulator [Methanotrichaceae archaeon]|nr:response regulator [Methanotrichaceae archaeon]
MNSQPKDQTADILIVDDTLPNLKLLSQMLTERGYQVRAALNGARALAAVQSDMPDIILLDIMMPGMDGYEVCRRLKSDLRTREIPVLFISALSETEDKVKGFEAGGLDYITKPFQLEEVLARVETHLKLRALQKEIRQKEEVARALLDASHDAAYLVRIDGTILTSNEPGASDFGRLAGDLTGQCIWDLLSNEVALDRRTRLGEVASSGQPDRFVDQCEGRYLDNVFYPLFDDQGQVERIAIYTRDITERKHSESIREHLMKELESKNAEMDRFVYTVSHDLRSPLVTVNGFVGFIKSDLAKGNYERMETYLKMISTAVSKMDKLLNDTLQLSRIGRIASPPELVSFSEIIQEAVDLADEKIRSRGARIEIQPDLPEVNVDRTRIVEVMVNLLENSVKYMGDQQHPEIVIGCRSDDGEKVLFVKDNGMGIDKSQHDKAFDLFYKINRNSEGSGAGLAIVKRIIEVHGGRIWIESSLGEGCTICFTLPVLT